MKYTKGYIALTAVLVISAIFLSMSVGIASRAISELDISNELRERDTVRFLAEACGEHALMELLRTFEYEGNESILIGEESCEIHQVEGVGNTNRTINVESTVGSHTYRIHVVVGSVSPDMEITSFESVTNF